MRSPSEIFLVVLVLLAAATAIVLATRGARRVGLALAALVLASTAAGSALLKAPREIAAAPGRPRPTTQAQYVTQSACRGCHPGEHASFGRTFHRTMTREASRATTLAALGTPLDLDGRKHLLEARGEEIWATLPDPETQAEVTRRVSITTGSHREQAFWVSGKREGELRLFPFVWLVREARYVPRRDAFLVPPDAPMPAVRWNSNCIACHAVAGEPGHDPARDAFDTRVAELGIACEACHGPGAEHAARHRDPVERYVQHASKRADPTIANPRRLSPERSAALCGQCHAYSYPKDEDQWWTSGYARSYRAGDALEPSRSLIEAATFGKGPRLDASLESLFWPDGSIRVGGREYNGLVLSPCYERGEGARKMTCLSCHAMHAGDPSGQIAPDRASDRACTQCHEGKRSAEHGHHPNGSASCVDCHMPKTSYALFSAIRSHRIDSPTTRADKPNACNLCHLDRTLAWTSRWLATWYGAKPEATGDSDAFGLVSALSGDAAVRVVIADALGSPSARAAGGTDFEAVPLAELLVDPYAAVRFVAGRSLRVLPGYADIPYDFLAPPDARARAKDEVLARLLASRAGSKRSVEDLSKLGMASPGALDRARLDALLAARDMRRITIAE